MLKKLTDGRMIDTLTGEVLNEQTVYVKSNETVKIVNVTESNCERAWGQGRPYIKLFIDYVPQLALRLSGGALAIVFRLSEYMRYETGLIARHKNGEGDNPLNNEDIQQMMGYSNKTIIKLMGELVDKKVLFRGRTGHSYQYYANPYLFFKGTTINKTLIAMFKNYTGK